MKLAAHVHERGKKLVVICRGGEAQMREWLRLKLVKADADKVRVLARLATLLPEFGSPAAKF